MGTAPAISPGLSATQLKYFAAAVMVLDHWNMLFRPLGEFSLSHPLASDTFYLIGRMVFPVFAFFVAEGMRHTHDRRKYLLRLGLFGAVTQLPFLLGKLQGSGSVIATFFLAAAGIFAYDRLKQQLPRPIALLPLAACAALAHLATTDYGWMGVVTVAAVYLAGASFRRRVTVLALCMAVLYLLPFPDFSLPDPTDLAAVCTSVLAVALLALTYNHQRGQGSKWFFYWFYPAHLIVLGGLSMIL